MRAVCDGGVGVEGQFGRHAQIERVSKLAADKAGCRTQALGNLLGIAAERGIVHFCILEVGGAICRRNADKGIADARVLYSAQNEHKLLLHFFVDSALSVFSHIILSLDGVSRSVFCNKRNGVVTQNAGQPPSAEIGDLSSYFRHCQSLRRQKPQREPSRKDDSKRREGHPNELSLLFKKSLLSWLYDAMV